MHCHRNYTVTVISLETSAGWAGPAQESEPVIPFNPAETYHTVVTHGNQNDEYDIPITKKGADSTFDFMLKLQYYFQNTPKTLTTFKERVIKLAVERRDDHLYRNALYFDPQDPRFSNGAIFEVTFQRRYDIVVVAHPRTHREPSPRSTVAYVSRSKPIAKPLSQPTRMGTAPAPRPSSPPNHPAQPNPPMPQNGAENAGTVEANAPPPRPNAAPDGVDGGTGIAKQSASLIVDTLPVAGTFKSLFQLAAGYDPITGETIDRRMELAGLALSVIPGGKLLTKGKKLANLGEELLEHVDDINKVAKAAERGGIAPIHKNSLNYVGDTHVYVIRKPDGSLFKVGESAQGVRVGDEMSIRAEQQARALQRETGDFYTTEIRQNFGGKADARAYETKFIQTYERLYGKRPPGNPLDR